MSEHSTFEFLDKGQEIFRIVATGDQSFDVVLAPGVCMTDAARAFIGAVQDMLDGKRVIESDNTRPEADHD